MHAGRAESDWLQVNFNASDVDLSRYFGLVILRSNSFDLRSMTCAMSCMWRESICELPSLTRTTSDNNPLRQSARPAGSPEGFMSRVPMLGI
jgi:hypothetical protein